MSDICFVSVVRKNNVKVILFYFLSHILEEEGLFYNIACIHLMGVKFWLTAPN